MKMIDTIEALEAVYGIPKPTAMRKVADRMVPVYRDWICASRFCILATVGPEGTDASPRGDASPVVRELDETHLALPDWHGNNRIDSLRNIVRDGRVSLTFLVPGNDNVVRINGHAGLTLDADLLGSFSQNGKTPRSVIVISIAEIYFQCSRALMRSELWTAQHPNGLPTPGQILSAMTDGEAGGKGYDDAWPDRAAREMW